MEENNYQQEANHHSCHDKHAWKKCLMMMLCAFFGGFLAFYFVADQMMERHHRMYFNPHKFEKRMFQDMDKMYKRDMKAFEDAFKNDNPMKKMKQHMNLNRQDFQMPMVMMDSVKIKTEFDDNNFKVIVGLKPFQNDMNKVQYKANGRKLTVFGSSIVKDKNYEHDVAFSQDLILPENADTSKITKEQDGDKLIILVPLK